MLSKLASMPSYLVMWSRPAWSRNASRQVRVVTPPDSRRSIDSTASVSGQPSNRHVCTDRVGGSTSRYVPRNAHSTPSSDEYELVVAAHTQVDRALRHHLAERRDGLAHVLLLREDVEHERDRRLELACDEDLQLARKLDHGRSMLGGRHPVPPSRCSFLR